MFAYFRYLISFISVTSGWQKSMETTGYGVVAQESRNDGQILLLFHKYIAIQ